MERRRKGFVYDEKDRIHFSSFWSLLKDGVSHLPSFREKQRGRLSPDPVPCIPKKRLPRPDKQELWSLISCRTHYFYIVGYRRFYLSGRVKTRPSPVSLNHIVNTKETGFVSPQCTCGKLPGVTSEVFSVPEDKG